jgi:Domain of unknown function (DUF4345)
MTPARAILWFVALGFLGCGLAFTLWPLPMARLIEIPLPTPTARIDFAATYGGFELGFAAFLIVCARRDPWLAPGLWAMSAALAGFALVRIQSLLVAAGPATTPIYVALTLELTGTAAGIWALRRSGAP